jgi:glucosamine--fructose-6-phosphate aminotransferase (isomerizing)
MTSELIPQEIQETPTAIRSTLAETRPAARKAADRMHARPPGRIFIIGNGTSLYSSMAAAYTARLLEAPGGAFVLAMPAGDFRYFSPSPTENDIVVGVSASGEFRDVLAVFQSLQGRCLRVGITHAPGSSITKLADTVLVSAGGPSQVPVMTKTYASTLTAIHTLLLEYFNASQSYWDDLAASADRCAEGLASAEPLIPEISAAFSGFEQGFYFGAGNAYAAALEGALKMKEMALLHAEGSETWEMASGPATMVSEKTFCVALYSGDPSDSATSDGAKHAAQWGAKLLEVGPHGSTAGWHFPVKAPRYQAFASLALVPPLALLAYRVARRRGATPDTPQWRQRYYSQGMTHILGK